MIGIIFDFNLKIKEPLIKLEPTQLAEKPDLILVEKYESRHHFNSNRNTSVSNVNLKNLIKVK